MRAFIGDTVGDHACAEVAILLASELVTNSVLHSASRLDGTITVNVTDALNGGIRVEVTDAGGGSVPVLRSGDGRWAESGRGLQLVEDLSADWDYRIERDGRLVTWFEVKALMPSLRPMAAAGQEIAPEPGCDPVDTVPALASRQAGAHRPAGWRPQGWVAVSPEILRRVKAALDRL